MNRFRRICAASAVAIATVAPATPYQEVTAAAVRAGPVRAAPARPNVVVILVDDLGWPDVSSYGRTTVRTPNIDRIAHSGVAFSNGYAAASVCAVSRAGLLTGRWPASFGFDYNLGDAKEDGDNGLPLSATTLAERLKPMGYRTAAIGKWHQGYAKRFYPTNRGFDEFFGFIAGKTVYVDPATPGMVTTQGRKQRPLAQLESRKEFQRVVEGPNATPVNDFNKYLTYEITDHAVDFIDRSAASKDPFFAYVAYNAPHWPLQVPQTWYDKFPEIKDPIRRTYVAMIAAMDDGVGKILDALERQGVRDNTLVVFLSDNGCPQEFGFCDLDHPLGAGKFTYLEGGTRVPFLMSWPAGMSPRGIVDTPVASIDVVPTVLHAAAPRAPLPKELDGVDLVASATRQPAQPRLLFWGQAPLFVARQGNMKLWRSDDWDVTRLYALDKDAWERNDLSAENPAELKKLEGALDIWRKSLPEPLWPLNRTRKITIGDRETEGVF